MFRAITCLRLIDCTEETPREMPAALGDGVFGFWDMALGDILAEWDDLSDPVNLQPPVRLLNRQVAAFIRAHPPNNVDADKLAKALDVLESAVTSVNVVAIASGFEVATAQAALGGIWTVSLEVGGLSNSAMASMPM